MSVVAVRLVTKSRMPIRPGTETLRGKSNTGYVRQTHSMTVPTGFGEME